MTEKTREAPKWRKWNLDIDKSTYETIKPLPGYRWVPAVIDVYGKKLKVNQLQKIGLEAKDPND